MTQYRVRLSAGQAYRFDGELQAAAQVLDHDGKVRRCFRLYKAAPGFVAERIDYPNTIDERFWGALCGDGQAVYEFFGTEPLANYLYGLAGLAVPGLRIEGVGEPVQ